MMFNCQYLAVVYLQEKKKNSNLMCFNLTVAISIRVGPATSTALNTLVGVKREDRSEIEEDML